MVMMRDPNWDGPGPGPMIDVPSQAELQASSDALYNYRNSFVTPAAPAAPAAPDAPAPPVEKTYSEDSRISIKALLAKYKIPGLFDTIWSAYTGDTLDFTNEDAVTLYIRETPEYKKRFAGNEARRAKGLPDLSIATYIGMEDSYRNTLKSNGMPANMYNEENMAELIGGDVDVKEFNDRISYARDVMMDSPAGVRAQMSELYGITEGQMLAYFVDPERTAPILKEQARGARIGNIAKENARIQLTGAEATDLAKRGITDAKAQTAFTNISGYGELNTQLSGEETITQSEKIGSELGYDPMGTEKLKNRQKRRVGEFAGGGGFAQSQALGGTMKTGIGSAE